MEERYIVTLSVPVDRDSEQTPDQWDWQTLLDTTRPVRVISMRQTELLTEDTYGEVE